MACYLKASTITFAATAIALISSQSGQAATISTSESQPIDLTTWQQEGSPENGNWVVSPDGSSVLQTINGIPTFFVSPDNFIDTEIKGKFGVASPGNWDDDWIGFVFGYQSPIAANGDELNNLNFLLFDWKQNGGISRGNEGFSLIKVDGNFTNLDATFWRRSPTPEFEFLATNYGSNKGWRDNTEYDFTLLYQSNRIKIDIDGSTIFDIEGEFEPGRFGFYNHSQEYVGYSGLTQKPAPVPESSSVLALLGVSTGSFLLAQGKKRKSKALSN